MGKKLTIDQLIDETSNESFPASDPPAWVWGEDGKNLQTPKHDERQNEEYPVDDKSSNSPISNPDLEKKKDTPSKDMDEYGLVKPENQEDG